MNDQYVDKLLQLARQAGVSAEAIMIQSEESPVVFEANRLKSILGRQVQGCAIRLIKNGRIGFAATNRLDDPAELLEMAVETAEFGAEAKFSFPGAAPLTSVVVYDPAIEQITVPQQVELGQKLIDRLREGNDDVLCEARVSRSVTEFLLRNTSGADIQYRKSMYAYSVEGTRIRGTDMLFVGDGEVNCRPPSDPMRVAEIGRQQLEWCRENVPAPSGQVPVLFTPDGVAGILALPLSIAFSGKTVLQGASPIGNRRGERVFDERLSIWDDGTIEFRPGSEPADDEGVPVRRNPLVENGVVANFYYDLQTAGLAGTQSTGNAGRSLESLPSPSLHNVIISSGDRSFEDLLRDLHDGIVVEAAIGAGQGNVLGGEFGGNVILGYRVQNGQIVGRVKDTMIAGNVYEALRQVGALGSDVRWVNGAMSTPSILVPNVSVSTASES